MSGIGIIIILLQTLPFLGSAVVSGGPVGSILAWPDAIRDINLSAFAIASVTLVVGVLWPSRLAKYLPPTLAALALGNAPERPLVDPNSSHRPGPLRTAGHTDT